MCLAELLHSTGTRHGLSCWHGTPSSPWIGFFDDSCADEELAALSPGTLGLVGHTHAPMVYFREDWRLWAERPEPEQIISYQPEWVVVANPGAVAGSDHDPAPWWLELVLAKHQLRWHRLDCLTTSQS